MKLEVKKGLKEKGRGDVFTDERFQIIKEFMNYSIKADKILGNYLSISPDFKVEYMVDHIIKFVDLKKI